MQYDGTVRNSERTVIQFIYGDDGLDPARMEDQTSALAFGAVASGSRAKRRAGADRPVNFPRLLLQTSAVNRAEREAPLSPRRIRALAKAAVDSRPFQMLLPQVSA